VCVHTHDAGTPRLSARQTALRCLSSVLPLKTFSVIAVSQRRLS